MIKTNRICILQKKLCGVAEKEQLLDQCYSPQDQPIKQEDCPLHNYELDVITEVTDEEDMDSRRLDSKGSKSTLESGIAEQAERLLDFGHGTLLKGIEQVDTDVSSKSRPQSQDDNFIKQLGEGVACSDMYNSTENMAKQKECKDIGEPCLLSTLGIGLTQSDSSLNSDSCIPWYQYGNQSEYQAFFSDLPVRYLLPNLNLCSTPVVDRNVTSATSQGNVYEHVKVEESHLADFDSSTAVDPVEAEDIHPEPETIQTSTPMVSPAAEVHNILDHHPNGCDNEYASIWHNSGTSTQLSEDDLNANIPVPVKSLDEPSNNDSGIYQLNNSVQTMYNNPADETMLCDNSEPTKSMNENTEKVDRPPNIPKMGSRLKRSHSGGNSQGPSPRKSVTFSFDNMEYIEPESVFSEHSESEGEEENVFLSPEARASDSNSNSSKQVKTSNHDGSLDEKSNLLGPDFDGLEPSYV